MKELRIAVIIVSDENEGNANVLKREFFFFLITRIVAEALKVMG